MRLSIFNDTGVNFQQSQKSLAGKNTLLLNMNNLKNPLKKSLKNACTNKNCIVGLLFDSDNFIILRKTTISRIRTVDPLKILPITITVSYLIIAKL